MTANRIWPLVLNVFLIQLSSEEVTKGRQRLISEDSSKRTWRLSALFCLYYWQSKVYLFEEGESFREHGTVYTGTGNYWQSCSCIFQSLMNYPLRSCRKMIPSPFLFGLETDPWLIPLLGENEFENDCSFFKEEITFFLFLFFFFLASWDDPWLRSPFFWIALKHYICWQLANQILSPELSFLDSQPVSTTSQWTAILGCPRDTTNSLLFLFASSCVSLLTNSPTVRLLTRNETWDLSPRTPPTDFLHPNVNQLQNSSQKCCLFSTICPLVQQRWPWHSLPSLQMGLFQLLLCPLRPCVLLTCSWTVTQTPPVVSIALHFACCCCFFKRATPFPSLPDELIPQIWGLRPPSNASFCRAFLELPKQKWPLLPL